MTTGVDTNVDAARVGACATKARDSWVDLRQAEGRTTNCRPDEGSWGVVWGDMADCRASTLSKTGRWRCGGRVGDLPHLVFIAIGAPRAHPKHECGRVRYNIK